MCGTYTVSHTVGPVVCLYHSLFTNFWFKKKVFSPEILVFLKH